MITKKTFFSVLLITIATLLFFPQGALAYDYVPSAILQSIQNPTITPIPNVVPDYREKILEKYLETRNSPLAPYAKNFIEEADEYKLDWKLVPAIAGVESSYGIHIPYNSYNGWGYGIYGGNVRRFASWEDGISTVSRAIQVDYIEKWKAKNIYQIGDIYAADPRWSSKVAHFIAEITSIEKAYQPKTFPLTISL